MCRFPCCKRLVAHAVHYCLVFWHFPGGLHAVLVDEFPQLRVVFFLYSIRSLIKFLHRGLVRLAERLGLAELSRLVGENLEVLGVEDCGRVGIAPVIDLARSHPGVHLALDVRVLLGEFGLAVEHGLPACDEVVRGFADVLHVLESLLEALLAALLAHGGLHGVLHHPGTALDCALGASDAASLRGHRRKGKLAAVVEARCLVAQHVRVVQEPGVHGLGETGYRDGFKSHPEGLPGQFCLGPDSSEHLAALADDAHARNEVEAEFAHVAQHVLPGDIATCRLCLLDARGCQALQRRDRPGNWLELVVRSPSFHLVLRLVAACGAVQVLLHLLGILVAHLHRGQVAVALRVVAPVAGVLRVGERCARIVLGFRLAHDGAELLHEVVNGGHLLAVNVHLLG